MISRLSIVFVFLVFSLTLFSQNEINSYNDKGGAKAVYSPDKSIMAVADGKSIKFYSAGTSTLLHSYRVSSKDITSISFNAEGDKVLIGGYSNEVRVVEISTGEYTMPIAIPGDLAKSSHYKVEKIHPVDYRRSAVVYSNSVNIFDWENQDFSDQQIFDYQVRALAINPVTGEFIIGGGNKEVNTIDSESAKELKSLISTEKWVMSLTVDPEAKYLAVGTEDGKVKILDLESGEELRQLDNMKGEITDLEFSGDGQYLVIVSTSGVCHLFSMQDMRINMTLDKFGNGLIGATFDKDGQELATVESFQRIRTWDISALNISPVYDLKDENDKTGPSIFLSNPPNIVNDRVTFSEDVIRLQGVAIDESGVKSVTINNINTPIKENGNFTINLPLTMGENFISIEVADINDNISVKRFVINRRNLDGTGYNPTNATNYLFVVGINNYQHWPKLFNAVRDAEQVANVLIGSYGYSFTNVTMLLDEKATLNNIYQELRGLIEKITPQDNLLVYYSGHGYFDDLLNEGYWVPYDANEGATGEYLSNSNLLKILNNINSQHTFLVVDACFSGSLFAQQTRGYTDNVEKYKSRWGLASGRLETVSDGAYGANSPFATKFLEYLKTTDKDEFPVSELVQFVKIEVANETEQTPIGNPIKSLGDEGGELIFRKNK